MIPLDVKVFESIPSNTEPSIICYSSSAFPICLPSQIARIHLLPLNIEFEVAVGLKGRDGNIEQQIRTAAGLRIPHRLPIGRDQAVGRQKLIEMTKD